MSNFNNNLSFELKHPIKEMECLPEDNTNKMTCTTKFTENLQQFTLPDSFIIGKNDLLEENTDLGYDSDDNDSNISFEDRLELEHENIMIMTLYKYFSQNSYFNKKILNDERINLKSKDLLKEIEEKTIEEIKRKNGFEEAEKIKLVLNFLKKNEDTTKIYHEVIKTFSPEYRVPFYFLLKETVRVYLGARQELKQEWREFDQNEINSYFNQNLTKICSTIQQDEKLAVFKTNASDNMLNKEFEEFILKWMSSFYLAKEGLPSKNIEKDRYNREWPFEGEEQGELHKKIKKN